MTGNLDNIVESSGNDFSNFDAEAFGLFGVKRNFVTVSVIMSFVTFVIVVTMFVVVFFAFVSAMMVMVCQFVVGVGITSCKYCAKRHV